MGSMQVRGFGAKLAAIGGRGISVNLLGLIVAGAFAADYVALGAWIALATLVLVLVYVRLLVVDPRGVLSAIKGDTHRRALGSYTLSRAVIALSAAFVIDDLRGPVAAWLTAGAFGVAIISEPVLGYLTRMPNQIIANAPWAEKPRSQFVGPATLYLLNTYGLIGVVVMLLIGINPAIMIFAPAIGLGIAPLLTLQARAAVTANRLVRENLRRNLTEYAPKFVFYWEAVEGTSFQAAMWLPYLDRLGERYSVILRNEKNLPYIAPLTDAPVIVCAPMADLDSVVVPSLKAAFYVNNSIRNCHFVRYPQLTHIQLNHGDSDKAPSFNPVMRMYDRNFVAGQAAVDRFAANGVDVRSDFFTIVGRPQVSEVLVNRSTLIDARNTVLYAPTWAGFMADSNYSSLPVGPQLIRALLDRGVNVIFRPHPHSRKSRPLAQACDQIEAMLSEDRRTHGRAHVFGDLAEKEMTIFECFNASDAMISDVSSVVPDYLFSEKPFALVAMNCTVEQFKLANPISVASYVIDERLENLDAVLGDFLGTDSIRDVRKAAKVHYLGDFGEGAAYEQVFLDEARRYL